MASWHSLFSTFDPRDVAYDIAQHAADKIGMNWAIFSGAFRDQRAVGVVNRGLGFKDSVAAVLDESGGDGEFLPRPCWLMKAGGHFRAVGESIGGDRTGPDHDLIKDGSEDAAVGDVLKSAVFGPRHEGCGHRFILGNEAQIQTQGIVLPTDKAGSGMRQLGHGRSLAMSGAYLKLRALSVGGQW